MDRLETLESILERLRLAIRKNGLKNSKQREEVVSVLYKSGTHLSPEEITQSIRQNDKNTSISSVYRILNFLEKENFIYTLETNKNGRRYEIAAKEHHDHIICLHCGEIIEFVDREIEERQNQVAKKHQAKLVSHDMKLFVVCSKCLAEGAE
ncbi:transcriptional repressor [Helicobacter heilmannii]|uniref:Ferric uptake regulation protein n=1 Tax=Helicobacter heilmannii TaxID=35817 RepID=A0A0K2XEV8_HELHE|nr:transcriptional repressor [Helicobacter heilmannii]CCM12289.1 Ferric uptake regulation protein FUR [Helicobacter heilmannii ASB1.4]CRF45816.1 Ferric uptake regulation protein FUR [Helicobacter heilmannii]CRF51165.1 Ferric uptake regulation protein FUR [Helicobacter heilmannii]CRI34083.1 Ferric uptake regulation protein FUR [Helicobacter heilmannii]